MVSSTSSDAVSASGFHLPYAGALGLRSPDRPLFLEHVGSSDPVEQIACLADFGFAGVFDNFLTLRDTETQEKIGRAADRHGLAFGSITLRTPIARSPDWHRSDPDARATLVRTMNVSIDAAKRVGSKHITVVSDVDRARSRDRQIAAFTDNLSIVADHAAAGGVTLNIEPTSGPAVAPGLLIEHMAEAADIVASVNHPAVMLVYDVGHISTAGDDLYEALALVKGRIGAVQLADGPSRAEVGAGSIDWPPLLRAIRATGYTGLYEVEALPSEDGINGERALLRRLRAVDSLVDRTC